MSGKDSLALSSPTFEIYQAHSSPEGKSQTLTWLARHLRPGCIPDFIVFTTNDWAENRSGCIAVCARRFATALVAVRSDAGSEDSPVESLAGAYLSILNVSQQDLAKAVDKVVERLMGPDDQVMVQLMAPSVVFAGVASTHRIADGAPWYCIEMAPQDTAAVTGGRASGRQVAFLRDNAALFEDESEACEPMRLVLSLLRAVEQLFGGRPIEIEFALGAECLRARQVFLLQARPIAAASGWAAATAVPPTLPRLDFLALPDPCSEVAGQRTVLSLMSDWNPAELLGSHPRPLALSLFELLIAQGTWWRARSSLGYAAAPTADINLLKVLRGRPFVDVRGSANSLLPRDLPNEISEVLVNKWVTQLRAEPELHDKVEYQIFRTVKDFVPAAELSCTYKDSLADRQLLIWDAALGQLSRSIVGIGKSSPLARCSAEIDRLYREPSCGRRWPELLALASQGTFVFCALARIAFAADAQLRSAVLRGALDPDRVAAMHKAGRSMPLRCATPGSGTLDHLRAGTFDITQPTWAISDFRFRSGEQQQQQHETFLLRETERRALQSLLREAGFSIDAADWITFVQRSRQAREWAKFVFSRHLSAALEDIAAELQASGVDRECASWLTIAQLRDASADDALTRRRQLLNIGSEARQQHLLDGQVIVSPVLLGPRDRTVADSFGALPNFVGRQSAEGRLVQLVDSRPPSEGALRGAIVVLNHADPGFDWLFEYEIAGLITAWGGANSHMAIRCAECGLTAAIGCGEPVYDRATKAQRAHIDPIAGAVWLC